MKNPVIATDGNEIDEKTCSWVVVDPLTVDISHLDPALYGSPPTVYGLPPTFTATVNKNATITFYLDDVFQKSELGLSAEFTPSASIASGEHHVRVVAEIGNESDEKTYAWIVYMKETPPADVIVTFPLAPNETRVQYSSSSQSLMFRTEASGLVIKLTGEWPCKSIYANHPNITLDLEGFIAPHLTQIFGSTSLEMYNFKLEKTYASHESGTLLSSVKNIYNSRIVVSRPGSAPNVTEYNIAAMYGEMAFCEIRLTNAPVGCKCIGAVMHGGKICDTNILSCPDVIPAVPCPGIGPGPLTVTMSGPRIVLHGSPPTFTATANKNASFTFYVDTVFQKSESGISAEFTPDASIPSGKHSVRIVTTSGIETSDKTYAWIVHHTMKKTPPADVTLTYPLAPNETMAELSQHKLLFNAPASGKVIKLTGEWPCTTIWCSYPNITLDLEDFIAPDLVNMFGNETFDIYNWNFEIAYAGTGGLCPICDVRNIYNSRIIVVSRPYSIWASPTVENIYGEIAFCEISAPVGNKCIGTVGPGARICDENIFSYPDDIPTVPCPHLGIITPNPAISFYGSPPTFSATIHKNAHFTFYVDDVLQKSESGMKVEFTPDDFVASGKHQVRVVAETGNEKEEATSTWTVYTKKETPPADVTLTYPPPPNETRVTYRGQTLYFNAPASGQVIKLTGEWPCRQIYPEGQNITLDLDGFIAPNLTHFVGDETLDIYNYNFEKTYASHESGHPIGIVRNIYNSRIVVSRPNDQPNLGYSTIGSIYGEMACCEIRLTNAPARTNCIGFIQPSAKICESNIFSCPDFIPTVPCPHLDLPLPLTVSMPAPRLSLYGSPPTFSAKASKHAIFTFYLDDVFQKSESGISAEFTPDASLASGEHSVRVVTISGNEEEEATSTWTVYTMQEIMKPTPPADVILTYPLAPNETRAEYIAACNLLFFKAPASGLVIKLAGFWPCSTIQMSDNIYAYSHPNITLDLEDIIAPDLVCIHGSDTLDIYNWNFERIYAPHESGTPLRIVRNIYNSKIVVSRRNSNFTGPFFNIDLIYGEMAFCEIRLTDAPAGSKCIGFFGPRARICNINIFSCPEGRLGIPIVPCLDLEPVSAVSMPCHPGAPVDKLPTFSAYAENATEYKFFLDGLLQNTSGNTFTPTAPISEGVHVVKVVASNSISSSKKSCDFYVATYFETGVYYYVTDEGKVSLTISELYRNIIVDPLASALAWLTTEFYKILCNCDIAYEKEFNKFSSIFMGEMIKIGLERDLAHFLNDGGSLTITLPDINDILNLNNIIVDSATVEIIIKYATLKIIIPEDL